eukprot:478652-Pyramimonas_sp.AAC.1
MLNTVGRVQVQSNSARRLQLTKSREPRDHRPVLITNLVQISDEPMPRRPPRPSREALDQCVKTGSIRHE